MVSSAFLGQSVGGNLRDSFSVVLGLKTFPAVVATGKPSAPTTES
jgi:hypothetical protein